MPHLQKALKRPMGAVDNQFESERLEQNELPAKHSRLLLLQNAAKFFGANVALLYLECMHIVRVKNSRSTVTQ